METVISRSFADIVADDADDAAVFRTMLESANLNPFLTWEAQRDQLAADPLYLSLSTNADRASVFRSWAEQAQVDEKEGSRHDAPKGDASSHEHAFVLFIHENFRPGKVYAEFKRQNRHSSEFKNSRLPDKRKQSLYREYVAAFKATRTEREPLLREFYGQDAAHHPLYHS